MSKPKIRFGDLKVGDVFRDAHKNVWVKTEQMYISMGSRDIPRNAQALKRTMIGVTQGDLAFFPDYLEVELYSREDLACEP